MKSKKIYCPYNETFDRYFCRYSSLMTKKEALEFINLHNQCLGGHYVLHTNKQYKEWLKTHPKPEPKPNPLLESMINPLRRAVYPNFLDAGFVSVPAFKEKK